MQVSHNTYKTKTTENFFVQTGQDAIFFGCNFLHQYFESKDCEITSYVQDGDLIFKNQKCFKIHIQNTDINKQDILNLISYFCGAYTLISCFLEKSFKQDIFASTSKDFDFQKWEKSIILQAGALLYDSSINLYQNLNKASQAIETGEKHINLSTQHITLQKALQFLQAYPQTSFSLHGDFFPKDLEKLDAFNIKSITPLCLQGDFPSIKMHIIDV